MKLIEFTTNATRVKEYQQIVERRNVGAALQKCRQRDEKRKIDTAKSGPERKRVVGSCVRASAECGRKR